MRGLEVGRVFVIPLLGGGFGFGVITFVDRSIGMFCDVFDALADDPEPPADLASRPRLLRDRWFGAELQLRPGSGTGERWRPTAVSMPGVAPSTRWYLTGGPPRPYFRKDLYRELPPEPVDPAETGGLLRLSARFPPYLTAEVEVGLKRLDLTPDAWIAAWRAGTDA